MTAGSGPMTGMCSRRKPCPSCPYRVDAPSGLWAEAEYLSLRKFDGDILAQVFAQADALFCCHSSPDQLCAGWVGHRDHPTDLVAIRLGISRGKVDPSVADYTTDVPLWSSGAEAAAHGVRDLGNPGPETHAAILKVVRARPDVWLDAMRRSGALAARAQRERQADR